MLIFEIITSVKGISEVTATEIIITTNEFKDISDPKKMAAMLDVSPSKNLLVKRTENPGLVQLLIKKVKSLLHMAALSAIQHCKELKEYYLRKVAEGKNKMLVLNNV